MKTFFTFQKESAEIISGSSSNTQLTYSQFVIRFKKLLCLGYPIDKIKSCSFDADDNKAMRAAFNIYKEKFGERKDKVATKEKEAKEPKVNEAKQRLDSKCWKGYRKKGTKIKGDTRVNNCVKENLAGNEEISIGSELRVDGKPCIVDEILGDTAYCTDQDGGDIEVNLRASNWDLVSEDAPIKPNPYFNYSNFKIRHLEMYPGTEEEKIKAAFEKYKTMAPANIQEIVNN